VAHNGKDDFVALDRSCTHGGAHRKREVHWPAP
jgi:hypothetical protein